jgi:hypothetical protein
MNRRRGERYTRRVEVQFWQAGEKASRGYSTNISAQGMHIATQYPLPPRSRLRIEVLHGERGFLIEGVVAHRRSVHPELRKVMAPGMGVRFLSAEELIGELFPLVPGGQTGAGQADEERPAAAATTATYAAEPRRAEGAEVRTFSVRFASPRDFLGVYERDIVNGGLFVATSRPGRVREAVWIEVHPPAGGIAPITLPARVVQRFEPKPASGAILVGMGVELLDLPEALRRLRPVVERLAAGGPEIEAAARSLPRDA